MVHTPGHKSKSSSVRKPGTKPPAPSVYKNKPKAKRPKSVRKPENTQQNRLRQAKTAVRASMVAKKDKSANAAKARPLSVRTDDQPSPGKPIGRQYVNKAKKRVAAANTANAPKKRVTPPADTRPKSKSSSTVKPTNEEARRTAQAKRLGTTPAAKKAKKIVTNAPVDMSGVKRMPDRSMAEAGAAGTKAFKKILKGPSKRVKTSVTPKTGGKAPKRKSMAKAGAEGTAAFSAMIKRVLGAGRQEGKGSLDSFAKGVGRAKVEAKGYDASMGKSAGSVTKAAPKKDKKGPKKNVASPKADYAPKASTSKEGKLSGIKPPKKPAMPMPKNLPKTSENVDTAEAVTPSKDAKVAKLKIGRGTPKGRYGAAPKQSQTSIQPKGNTGVVGKFEDKIGGFMSKVFGSYSAASGVEGTDSYTVKKYKKGKRV
mgnify:CR=1 FL=1|tara:strand:- start:3722 stop:4999 length:1278 start_codon:yes stop_codon:yes gene_type:complete